jgi:hypothetical protein
VAGVGLALAGAGVSLGTPLPPFLMSWAPHVDSEVWISAAAIAVALGVAPVILERLPPGVAVAGALYVIAVGLGLAINLAHEGARGWWAVFATGSHGSFEGQFEYLPGLPLLRHGVGYFLAHFGPLLYWSTTHIKGNPPGPLIALHGLGVDDAQQMAALCVGVGALSAPLAYDLGRTLGGERRGRIAGLLSSFSPAMLLFGVTSADYAFVTLGMLAACCLIRPGGRWLVAGAVATAVATFFSWLLFAIPAWAAVVVFVRRGWAAAARVAGAAAAGVVLFNGLLAVVAGYDPFSALAATEGYYRHGVAATRPYAFWLFGSPAAWILMVGLPIAWFSLRAALARDPAAIALWALVAAASLIGVTKAETERIWLPFIPLACVAAAGAVPTSRLRLLLLFLCAQALVIELLFFTVW